MGLFKILRQVFNSYSTSDEEEISHPQIICSENKHNEAPREPFSQAPAINNHLDVNSIPKYDSLQKPLIGERSNTNELNQTTTTMNVTKPFSQPPATAVTKAMNIFPLLIKTTAKETELIITLPLETQSLPKKEAIIQLFKTNSHSMREATVQPRETHAPAKKKATVQLVESHSPAKKEATVQPLETQSPPQNDAIIQQFKTHSPAKKEATVQPLETHSPAKEATVQPLETQSPAMKEAIIQPFKNQSPAKKEAIVQPLKTHSPAKKEATVQFLENLSPAMKEAIMQPFKNHSTAKKEATVPPVETQSPAKKEAIIQPFKTNSPARKEATVQLLETQSLVKKEAIIQPIKTHSPSKKMATVQPLESHSLAKKVENVTQTSKTHSLAKKEANLTKTSKTQSLAKKEANVTQTSITQSLPKKEANVTQTSKTQSLPKKEANVTQTSKTQSLPKKVANVTQTSKTQSLAKKEANVTQTSKTQSLPKKEVKTQTSKTQSFLKEETNVIKMAKIQSPVKIFNKVYPKQFQRKCSPKNNNGNKLKNIVKKKEIDFGQLSTLNPEKILLELSYKLNTLRTFLSETIKPINILFFVKCLGKLSAVQFDNAKLKLFNIICESNFVGILEDHCKSLSQHDNPDDVTELMQNILSFREAVVDLSASLAVSQLKGRKVLKNNIRDIAIVPSEEDLFGEARFVRPNIVDGAYDSVEHYLDVHFRLMREDFMTPMREALKEYKSRPNKKEYSGVRLYRYTRLNKYKLKRGVLALELYIPSIIPKHSYDEVDDKLFMRNSLLCLTCDNFKTVLICMVHDANAMEYGKILVIEVWGKPVTDDMFAKNFVAMESSCYFGPYFDILSVLQSPHTAKNFPFERSLVHGQVDELPPDYLKDFQEYELFDGSRVKLLHNKVAKPWSKDIGLDATQYEAYTKALCRKFVTIQGPPGTGKTYIAIMIASSIITNCYINKNGGKKMSPILVVCCTNHALDQFLEGLLNVTKKLVRVGGQSKNDNLEKYNLRNLRKWKGGQIKKVQGDLFKNARHLQTFLAFLKSIQSKDVIFDLTKNERVFCFRVAQDNIEQRFDLPFDLEVFLDSFDDGNRPALVNWLLLSDYDDDYKQNFIHRTLLTQSTEKSSSVNSGPSKKFPFTTDYLDFSLDEMRDELGSLNSRNGLKKHVKLTKIANCQLELNYMEMRLARGNSGYMKVRFSEEMDPFSFGPEQRWSLYWEWLNLAKADILDQFSKALKINQAEKVFVEEMKQVVDLDILKGNYVVGMTTSGAARNHSLLTALRAPIVIVEEAAAVLESHVVASLTKDCQHLIMIGDHQQLRTITATHKMGTQYNLDVSLFERMVNNSSHCYQLGVQHRMRPEIARLITPAIYKNLKNHSNVEKYPNIKGVAKSLFFIDHIVPEDWRRQSTSHRNDHEARFLLKLAKYFIQQGYAPDEITILSTYAEQTLHMCSMRGNIPELENIEICNLDGYQGKENKIILLSLVRSNRGGNIGFLKTSNRVCVALSRAREAIVSDSVAVSIISYTSALMMDTATLFETLVKEGGSTTLHAPKTIKGIDCFYMIGNMSILKRKSPLWKAVNNTLTKLASIGPNLILQCQFHPYMRTDVKTADDFSKVPYGGCLHPCANLMSCGHKCHLVCHTINPFHKGVDCTRSYCKKEKLLPSVCSTDCATENTAIMPKTTLTDYVAIDCEMVGIGKRRQGSMLARVSLVNKFGDCIYDKFVKPREKVTDYRTQVSGIRKEDLQTGEDFEVVQKKVAEIISNRFLVGHDLKKDLEVLFLSHPKKKIRDTSKYKPFLKYAKGSTPSLKHLAKELLGVDIQGGEHSSVEDARATMQLYTQNETHWEAALGII